MLRHCLPLLLASLSALQAQSIKAELFGIVRDPSGFAVNGASVELIHTGTDSRVSAVSDTNGRYHFFPLPAGSYQISIVKRNTSGASMRHGTSC